MYTSEREFRYQSSSKGEGPYDIKEIIQIIIRNKMQDIKSGMNLNRITDNYPAGTVGRWLQEINTLRILYALYSMRKDEIVNFFEEYETDDIIAFNKDIKDILIKRIDISEELKSVYLSKIDRFNITLIDNNMEENLKVEQVTDNSYNIAIKLIKEMEEMWNIFANQHKEEIFKILYEDEEMLIKCIKSIL